MSILSYRGYQAKVWYSEEDVVIIGEIVGISDSLSFYAERADEVEGLFHQCIDNYLEMCKEIGKDPDKVYKGSFNVRVTPELHKRAEMAALQREESLNQFVNDAIAHELDGRLKGWIYEGSAPAIKADVDTGADKVIDFVAAKAKNDGEEGEKWTLQM